MGHQFVSSRQGGAVAFVWDNFGPMHADRCDAVARALAPAREVVGLELFTRSEEYAWNAEDGRHFRKVTLYPGQGWQQVAPWKMAAGILKACRDNSVSDVFLCNYDRMGIFLAGIALRAAGKRVYVMGCSKFDDFTRDVRREAAKRIFFLPYQGAIASGRRSRDYMRFMGIREQAIATEYNTLSLDRIREMAGAQPAPAGIPFAERHFTIVARFVPKKNLSMALDAYRLYREACTDPRPLHLCGSGALEADLRAKVDALGLGDSVVFRGFLQTDGIAKVLATTLALVLPSIEEQFGNVVIEAQAMGLPVIVSDVCGARDNLVRSGVNGFVVEPDNPAGLAFFMDILGRDEALWRRQSLKAAEFAVLGDVAQFARAAAALTGERS
jgi:L-malate glycosyltransferase